MNFLLRRTLAIVVARTPRTHRLVVGDWQALSVTHSPWTHHLQAGLTPPVSDRRSILSKFGQMIVERRRALGISQEELAHRADLDRTYVSGLERGVRNPSLTAVVKVAQGLGITTDKLLQGLEDGNKPGRQR